MRRSKALLATALGVVAIGASALTHRPSPRAPDQSPLLRGARIDPVTLGIVERSCQNCHSERTEWPWYSHLPPASWLLHRDVAQARNRMNLSRWDGYTPAEQQALLSAIGGAARTGVMPPRRYTVLHPSSVLSPQERETLYRWTRAERSRLRTSEDPSVRPRDNRFLWDRRF